MELKVIMRKFFKSLGALAVGLCGGLIFAFVMVCCEHCICFLDRGYSDPVETLVFWSIVIIIGFGVWIGVFVTSLFNKDFL